MYEAFYNLGNDPFRLLPDPGICFPHRSCARAWAYLRYALKRGEGIVVVTGPPGSGKTTLADRLLTELNPARIVSVRLIANDLNAADLLRKLAYAFGLPAEGMDRAMLAHRIERYLIELEHAGRRALVVIDEAQTLSHQSLEVMRVLTDLQSRSRPVLQLILLGQEELEGVMGAPGMEQFQHRVIASCRLQTMDLAETKAYLEYRLAYADWRGDPSINGPAVMAIHRHSKGLPRHVNKICSRLLLHGCTEERHALNERDVAAVVKDLREELLAPLGSDATAGEPLSSGVFDSVYELALSPASRPAAAQDARVRDAAADLSPPPVPAADARAAAMAVPDVDPAPPVARRIHRARWHGPHDPRQALRPLLAALRTGRQWWHATAPRALPRLRRALAGLHRVMRTQWQDAVFRVRTGLHRLAPLAAVPRAAVRRLDAQGRMLAAGVGAVLLVGLGWLVTGAGGEGRVDPAGASIAAAPPVVPLPAEAAQRSATSVAVEVPAGPSGDVQAAEAADDGRAAEGDTLSPAGGAVTQRPSSPAPTTERAAPDTVVAELATVDMPPGPVADNGSPGAVSGAPEPDTPMLEGVPAEPLAFVAALPATAAGGAPVADPLPAGETAAEVVANHSDTPAIAAPAAAEPVEASVSEEVAQLVALGDEALAQDRLLLPEADSAYTYYRRALAIDEDDQAARSGMARIVDRYAFLADRSLRNADLEKADRYVVRALRVDPHDAEVLKLRDRIDEAEAEAAAMAAAREARMAADIPHPEPVAEPKKQKLSSFERLMRNVDGHFFNAGR